MEHGRRYQPLSLMTMDENLRFNKAVMEVGYQEYENYDAIEVPRTDAIPSDYEGVMGVPVSFLHKYNPDQFEIIGTMDQNDRQYPFRTKVYSTAECKKAYMDKFGKLGTYDLNASAVLELNGILEKVYTRIMIRHRKRRSNGK